MGDEVFEHAGDGVAVDETLVTAALLSGLRLGVVALSEDRHVILVNQAFCDTFYLNESPDDLVGRTAAEPFGNAELASRVHALLRRSGSRSAPTNRYDDGVVQIDFAHRTARVNDQPIALTPTEYRPLRTLVTYPGQVLSIEHLLEDAWRDPSATAPSRVKHTVRRLRGKLAACGAGPNVVEAVRGYGYRYRAPL